ncbi:MAG: hypothetical protein HUK15_07850 [Bacteroidales bacterium]|nr:hypothetical protein [Bacteroidales bacterium]
MNAHEFNIVLDLLDENDKSLAQSVEDTIVENFDIFRESLKFRYNIKKYSYLKPTIENIAKRVTEDFFDNDFVPYASRLSPQPSLLEGFCMLCKFVIPEFDDEKFTQYVNNLAKKVWLRSTSDSIFETLRVVSEVFYEEKITSKSDIQPWAFGKDFYESEIKSVDDRVFNVIFLSICQKNNLPIALTAFPISLDSHKVYISYVDKKVASLANIPSKYGAIFSIDTVFSTAKSQEILLSKPIEYYKYLKECSYWGFAAFEYSGYDMMFARKIENKLTDFIRY